MKFEDLVLCSIGFWESGL